jgi:hypothetical protein
MVGRESRPRRAAEQEEEEELRETPMIFFWKT